MKRVTFIIIAIMVLVLLVGAWLYSLVNGVPQQPQEFFANFSFWNTGTNTPFEVPVDIVENPEVPITPITTDTHGLRQLTTRPGVGYTTFERDTNNLVRFVEAGTGNVFEINVATGVEERVSNLTVPNAHEAWLSTSGDYVAIRAGYSLSDTVYVIKIGTVPEIIKEIKNADNVGFVDSILFYTMADTDNVVAYSYSPTTQKTTTVFTIPFFDAKVVWGQEGSNTLVYTKPAARLMGYAYEVVGGKLVRLPLNGLGLTLFTNKTYLVRTILTGTNITSEIYNRTTKEVTTSPLITLPEKCTFGIEPSLVFCGYQITDYGYDFPDNWYKGARSFEDSLWSLDLNKGISIQIANPQYEVGRRIDIVSLAVGVNQKMVYFMNDKDKTIWVYEF